MQIETGILVKIIGCQNSRMEHMVGHVGHVLRPDLLRENHWHIEGAEKNINGKRCVWHDSHLQPISDHRKTSWAEFDKIGWNPMRETECH